jgi:hypothetical protein
MPPAEKFKYWTAIYRVRLNGHEIGQTEQAAGRPGVQALIWDKRMQGHADIGIFANHEDAAEAVLEEWQRMRA